jgi:hypothetical protein
MSAHRGNGTQTLRRRMSACLLPLVLAANAACDRLMPQRDMALPDSSVVATAYQRHGLEAEYRFSGNVLEVVVQQPADQLRRGGTLWARVGPYIYLFTPATRDLLEQHEGLAGVRVITETAGVEIARALLARDALNEVTWNRALSTLSAALEEGTTRPTTMDRLATYGEQITTYEYNPDYVPPRGQ